MTKGMQPVKLGDGCIYVSYVFYTFLTIEEKF